MKPDPAPAPASYAIAPAPPATAHDAASPSVRPPAPELPGKPNGAHPSMADTFERLLSAEDVEVGLASLGPGAPPAASAAVPPSDLAEVRGLFAQLAAAHVRPVRDFVMDLRVSEAPSDWLPICQPALRSLKRAAEKLELTEVCAALEQVGAALDAAAAAGATSVSGDHRAAILARYEDLARAMPQAFALDLDRSQRDAVILHSLLLQVPGVKKVTIDKMVAAGLLSLEAMLLATPRDVASTTGIPEALAEKIVQRFRAYRDQVKATVPDVTHARERERLADLVRLLRRQHEEHERASQSWTREAEDSRKALRKARGQTMLDVQVELARLGEADRVAALDKLPFEAKVAALEAFLEEARDKYGAQP